MDDKRYKISCKSYPMTHYEENDECPWCQLDYARSEIRYLYGLLNLPYDEYKKRAPFFNPFDDNLITKQLYIERTMS